MPTAKPFTIHQRMALEEEKRFIFEIVAMFVCL
jgi:hypothetical protein